MTKKGNKTREYKRCFTFQWCLPIPKFAHLVRHNFASSFRMVKFSYQEGFPNLVEACKTYPIKELEDLQREPNVVSRYFFKGLELGGFVPFFYILILTL